MRTTLLVIAIAVSFLFIFQSQAQTPASGFPKGELSITKNHTGDIWLSELSVGDSTFDPSIAQAVYGPGAKLDWHIHPGGQVLLITEGTGYYQERGKPVQLVHKGDVIKCAPGVEHWHGAAPNSGFAYIAQMPDWPANYSTTDMIMDFTDHGPVARPDPWKKRLDLTEQLASQ